MVEHVSAFTPVAIGPTHTLRLHPCGFVAMTAAPHLSEHEMCTACDRVGNWRQLYVVDESQPAAWSLPPVPPPLVWAVRAERRDGSLGPFWHRQEPVPGDVRWLRYRNDASPRCTGKLRDIKRWAELLDMHGPDGYPIVRLVDATRIANGEEST